MQLLTGAYATTGRHFELMQLLPGACAAQLPGWQTQTLNNVCNCTINNKRCTATSYTHQRRCHCIQLRGIHREATRQYEGSRIHGGQLGLDHHAFATTRCRSRKHGSSMCHKPKATHSNDTQLVGSATTLQPHCNSEKHIITIHSARASLCPHSKH